MVFMYDLDKMFWSSSLEDLQRGYTRDEHGYVCLICGASTLEGRIYPYQDAYYDALRYMQMHMGTEHDSMLTYLLSFEKKLIGLTDHQKEVIRMFSEGKTDAEMAEQLGTSAATVRSHRFSLREKAKQAKLLLAVTHLMEAAGTTTPPFVEIHRSARMVDERYMVTEPESEQILKKYFPYGVDGQLTEFPRKEKRKLVILRQIAKRFTTGEPYTEAQVNEVLKGVYADYVTLRRYLIEYGFLDRKSDGSTYWLKNN